MSSGSCNTGCAEFRPHCSPGYIVCVKCGEVYDEDDVKRVDEARARAAKKETETKAIK